MAALPQALGVYFWAGYEVPNALVPGLMRLQQAGFTATARIRLVTGVRPKSAADRGEYRFDEMFEAEVPGTVPFLPAAVRSTQYQRAFDLPGLRTIVFTAYDAASEGHFFDSAWLGAHGELVRSEYTEMTVALYETQNGKGKQFIVCNWETDNNIYFEPYDRGAAARLDWMRRWFRLRQEGIRQGRAIAEANGWAGVEVNDAIEFNGIYFPREHHRCVPSGYIGDTLHTIIRDVKPDYASYSAWESTGRNRLFDDLMTVKQFLYAETGGHTRLMIGELGVTGLSHPSSPTPESLQSKAWRYINLAHAALRADIPVVILWKAWDYFGAFEGEGLFNPDGSERQILRDLQESFASAATISGVVDQFDMYGTRSSDNVRGFELYGRFPEARPGNATVPGWSGNYRAILEYADGEILAIDTWGESEFQINLALTPDDSAVRWFMVRVRRKRDGLTCPAFGPVRLNRIPPGSSDCRTQVVQRYWDYWA
jgi:hypothetical protein